MVKLLSFCTAFPNRWTIILSRGGSIRDTRKDYLKAQVAGLDGQGAYLCSNKNLTIIRKEKDKGYSIVLFFPITILSIFLR